MAGHNTVGKSLLLRPQMSFPPHLEGIEFLERAVIEKDVPGISEAIRMMTMAKAPRSILSRGVSGMRGRTLIVNMPGSEKGVRESIEALLPVLGHAVETLRGGVKDCGR